MRGDGVVCGVRARWPWWRGRVCALTVGVSVLLVGGLAVSARPAAAARAHPAKARHGHREPSIGLHRIGVSSTLVYTDGVRWAVYEPRAGVTRVMDTRTHTSSTRPDPEGCAGGLLAVGGGEILYACSDPQCPEALDACRVPGQEEETLETGRWVVEDVASGVQHPVDVGMGLPVVRRENGDLSGLFAIGSQWAVGTTASRFGQSFFFLDWRTGRVLEDEPRSAAVDYENLDSEALLTPMCRPLRRGFAPIIEGLASPLFFQPSVYAPPFLVEQRYGEGFSNDHLYLRRCGATREEVVPNLPSSEAFHKYQVLAGTYTGGCSLAACSRTGLVICGAWMLIGVRGWAARTG